MFEIKMTADEIIEGLRETYGKEFTAPDVRGFCAANDIAYQTVTKKIKEYDCGCSLVVKPQPSKLMLWVRFPPSAL